MCVYFLFYLIRQVILLPLSVLVLEKVGIFFEARGCNTIVCGLVLPAIIIYYGVASLILRHHLTQQLVIVLL
jgi:uncharacterized membrane protein YdjX (TVP38/TMEM64 family)